VAVVHRLIVTEDLLAALEAARGRASGQEWGGRSGRALGTLPADEHALPTPLRLLDIVSGVTAAVDEGTDHVRGRPCRHLAVRTNLGRASAATPGGVAVPARGRFEDLLGLEAGVWIDDLHVLRIAFCSPERTETLELWDFGVGLDDLDWTRLPTFRSPEEAARLADQREPGRRISSAVARAVRRPDHGRS
jgi:hypothetical protein